MGLKLKKNTAWFALSLGRFFVGFAKLVGILVASSLLAANAFANVVDSIEIARIADHAQITIRFTTEIQYLRHGPEDEGKFLRVFFRVTKPGFVENEVMQETLRSPKSDLIPRFTVAYPEVVNGMLINFAKTTQYAVRPGGDNRSILILVPLPPEQKGKGCRRAGQTSRSRTGKTDRGGASGNQRSRGAGQPDSGCRKGRGAAPTAAGKGGVPGSGLPGRGTRGF